MVIKASDTEIFTENVMSSKGRKDLPKEKVQETYILQKAHLVVAVAKDEAFCFYYKDNLRMLQEEGAKIVYFSPLHETKLPDGTQGILLGGGYPENYAKQLSENESMKASIKKAIENKIPCIAECGGFLYLHKKMRGIDNVVYEMAGGIDAECFYTGKLVRFGYVEVTSQKDCFLSENETIKGHEFHYYDSTDNGKCAIARKPSGKRSWECIHANQTLFAGFPHLYYPSNPMFVKRFLEQIRERG